MAFTGLDRLFDRGTYSRALRYVREGRVLGARRVGDAIAGVVQGSKTAPYTVQISLDASGQPTHSECSCPVGLECKHAAAVLLSLEGSEDGSAQGPSENPIQPGAPVSETHIDVAGDGPASDALAQLLGTAGPAADTGLTTTRRERFRLVFSLRRANLWDSAAGGPTVAVTPAVQYLRQDGALGGMHAYRGQSITEELGTGQAAVLDRLLLEGDQQGTLADYLEALLAPGMPLYWQHDQSATVQVLPLNHCQVRFRVDEVVLVTRECRFLPELVLSGADGASEALKRNSGGALEATVVARGDRFAVLTDAHCLWHIQTSVETVRLLRGLCEPSCRLGPGDIRELGVHAAGMQDLGLDPPPRQIVIVQQLPQPMLELKNAGRQRTTVHLSFLYDAREVAVEDESTLLGQSNGGAVIRLSVRNRANELQVDQFLRSRVPGLAESDPWASDVRQEVGMSVGEFLELHGGQLLEDGFTLRLPERRVVSRGRGQLHVTVADGNEWFEFQLTYVDSNGTSHAIDPSSFDPRLRLARVGNAYVLLDSRDSAALERYVAEGLDRAGTLRVARSNLELLKELSGDLDDAGAALQPVRDALTKLAQGAPPPDYGVPASFRGTLREYQLHGFRWLSLLYDHRLGSCLADDMGLGKTVQALAFLQRLRDSGALAPTLVVAPVSTLQNWQRELERFTPEIQVMRHTGPGRGRDLLQLSGEVVLTSYQTMLADIKMLRHVAFRAVILDEAQQVKNPATATSKAVRSLKALHRITLTGTPVENGTMELWSQMEFLNPGLLGSRSHFLRRFARPIETEGDQEVAASLRRRVQPFILRRRKKDVARDIPDKEELVIYVEMGRQQAESYAQLVQQIRAMVAKAFQEKGVAGSTMNVLEGLLRLRQLALIPQLAGDQFAGVPSAKLETLDTMLDEVAQEGHKALVFSQFVGCLKQIRQLLGQRKVATAYLDGSSDDRSDQIDAFQRSDGPPVFLLSLKAGGLGINLTAADYVILFDPWWNPAVEAQAIDRAHRLGQERKVIAYRLIVRNSVEEKILQLQERKRELVDALVTTETGAFGSLSEDDIMQLFEDPP